MILLWIDWSTKYNQFEFVLFCSVLFWCVCVRVLVCLFIIYLHIYKVRGRVCFVLMNWVLFLLFIPTKKMHQSPKNTHIEYSKLLWKKCHSTMNRFWKSSKQINTKRQRIVENRTKNNQNKQRVFYKQCSSDESVRIPKKANKPNCTETQTVRHRDPVVYIQHTTQ